MEPQNQVTVEITLRPSDFHTTLEWTRSSLLRAGYAVVAVVLAYNAWRFWPSDDSNFMACFAAVLAVLCSYRWIRIRYLFYRFPGMRESRRYTFTVDGVRVEAADGSRTFKWLEFTKIVESKRLFIFESKSGSGRSVPKRFLTTPDDIATLRFLIRQNFNGPRKLRID